MFGIGLPEMILILALALIVVGPDKLPELARSVAKGVMELKKTAEGLQQSLSKNGGPLDEIRPELEDTAKSLKENVLDAAAYNLKDDIFPLVEEHSEEAPASEQAPPKAEVVVHRDKETADEKGNSAPSSKNGGYSAPGTSVIRNTVREDLTAKRP